METLTDFLVSNYLWFLVVSIILIFALIGYLVDQQEQKKGLSTINRPKERELNMADLATIAQNKSLNNAVSDAARNIGSGANGPLPVEMPMSNQNMINEIQNGTNGEVPTAIQNPVGFDVLNK